MVLDQLHIHTKMSFDLYFTLYNNNNNKTTLQWIKTLNSWKKTGETPCDLMLHKDFLDMIPQTTIHKRKKLKKWESSKFKNFTL